MTLGKLSFARHNDAPINLHRNCTQPLIPAFVLAASALLNACSADQPTGSGDPNPAAGAMPGGVTAGGQASAGGSGGIAAGGAPSGATLGGTQVTPGLVGGGGNPSGATPGGAPALMPITIDDCGANNPAGLSTAQVQALRAGGSPGSMRVLYPYDGTVFPRGLTAPTLMWDGAGSDAVYVHIKSGLFEYHGCLKPGAQGQVQLPQAVWDKLGAQTQGPRDPFQVELTTLTGQSATGPVSARWIVAQATLKGSIYYNSYNSQLSGNFGNNGAILRLRPGQGAQIFARQNTCTGCHSVSANGERMIARELGIGNLAGGLGGALGGLLGGIGGGPGGAGMAGGGGGISDGQIYGLTPDTAPNPPPLRGGTGTAFSGLTPDGKLYLTSASTFGVGPQLQGGLGPSNASSVLYETDTGMAVADTGIPPSAMMPTFSADASLLAFSDAAQGGKAIVVMDFDLKARKAKNARTLFTHNNLLGWPFVLPDNRAVVFSITDRSDYGGAGVGIVPLSMRGPNSDLGIVDIQTKKVFLLAQAMGFRTQADAEANKTYLPFGAEELHQMYYPTISPVAAGGYFWLFFDSVRRYGNQGLHRQLWGAAISIASFTELSTGNYDKDPSFPAFYLAGQELPVANHRAFTALDPCKADGASCESGVDCCNGFCTNGICGRDTPRCSQTNEMCKSSSDCCNKADSCIGGFCGIILN